MVGRKSFCIRIKYWNRKIEFERCSRCKEVSDTTSGVGSSSVNVTLLKNSAEMTLKWHWNHHPIFGIWTLRQLHVGRNWWQAWPKCGAGCWAWGPTKCLLISWSLLCFIMKEYKRLVQYGTLYTIGIYWNNCRIVVITRIRSHVSACCSLILARFIVEIVISLYQTLHRIRAQSQHIEGSTSIPPGSKADASESRWI